MAHNRLLFMRTMSLSGSHLQNSQNSPYAKKNTIFEKDVSMYYINIPFFRLLFY